MSAFRLKVDLVTKASEFRLVPSADSSFHVVDFKRNGKSVSVKPTLLKFSDGLSLRYGKSDNGPPLVLLQTIGTQLEYFQALAP
jgi:hypothetical protein